MDIETVVVGPFETNCFVAWGPSRQALVIDPGADTDRIASCLADHRLTVAIYLITHGHMDHVSGLSGLHRLQPAPVAMHPDDLSWAFSERNQMLPYYGQPQLPAVEPRRLDDGGRYNDGGLAYEVLWTPGHTPGGVCFYFPAEKTLFTGDTLFAGSAGRTDFPGGDSATLSRSLARLAKLPGDTRVFAGHGAPTTIGEERRSNFFLQQFS